MGLGYSELRVGGRYMTCGGDFIRTITALSKERVEYVDQSGPGSCKKTTFLKRCFRVATDEDLENASSPSELTALKIKDRRVTNQLVGIVLHVQNQLDVWIKTLEQSVQHYDAALLPIQKAALKAIVKDCADLETRLERHRDDLAK
jgi:hypothetical protein